MIILYMNQKKKMPRSKVSGHRRSFRAIHKYLLLDPDTSERFSANAGDYWDIPADKILKNSGGTNLWLLRDGDVYKKTVKKKDLKDEIYEAQRGQRRILTDRKSVGRGLYHLVTASGKTYVIDGKGRMTQYEHYDGKSKSPQFSDQWLFDGLVNQWGNRVMSWDEVLRNPDRATKIRQSARGFGSLYVLDLDNGTNRSWSDKFDKIYKRLY